MTHTSALNDRAEGALISSPVGPLVVALKPFDGGDSSIAMARWLSEQRHTDLQAVGVLEMGDAGTAVAGLPALPEEYYQRERDEIAIDLRDRIASPGDQEPVRIDVLEGAPGSTVAHVAAECRSSMIVIGTGRHGMLGRFLYGERALDVVRSATTAVLVVPPDAEPPIERAIAAVDFSPASVRAVTLALEVLAGGGRLTLVHVETRSRRPDAQAAAAEDNGEPRARALLARFADALPKWPGIQIDTVLLRGDAVGALLRYAEEQGAELIACGRRRHSLVERLLVGTVSTGLIRGAPCSVLVAPEYHDDDNGDTRLRSGEKRTSANPDEWRDLLRAATERNEGRPAYLTLAASSTGGIESVERGYLLLTMEYDRRGGRADIILGNPHVVGSHITHRIKVIQSINMVTEPDGRDSLVEFVSRNGDCLLEFVDI